MLKEYISRVSWSKYGPPATSGRHATPTKHKEIVAMKLLDVMLAATAAAGLSLAPDSHAETAALTCTGTGRVQYAPGLGMDPRPNEFVVDVTLAPCLGTPVDVATARFTTAGSAPLSCEVLTTTTTRPVYYFSWGNGGTSQVSTTSVVIQRPLGQIVRVESGRVETGRFAGATVTRTYTFAQADLTACLTTGVTSAGGPVVVNVTGL